MRTARRRHRAIALATLIATTTSACGWRVTPPKTPITGHPPRIAERVVMRVDEAAAPWATGQLGEKVRDTLVAQGSFSDVAYPVEPRNPPPARLVVVARGDIDEEKTLGFFKAVVTGMFFFIPAGIIRYGKDYVLDATVTYTDGTNAAQTLTLQNRTRVSHTLFSKIRDYEASVREAAARDLAQQIGAGLRPADAVP